jgi:F420-non-reducing hydrogenase iron-sulfur subunit
MEGERLEMFNLGASDAGKFAAAVSEMTERARKLGPNPLKKKQRA